MASELNNPEKRELDKKIDPRPDSVTATDLPLAEHPPHSPASPARAKSELSSSSEHHTDNELSAAIRKLKPKEVLDVKRLRELSKGADHPGMTHTY
jgi:hypothetical protein